LLDVHRQVTRDHGVGGLRLAGKSTAGALDDLLDGQGARGLAQNLLHHGKRTHRRTSRKARAPPSARRPSRNRSCRGAILPAHLLPTSLDITFFPDTRMTRFSATFTVEIFQSLVPTAPRNRGGNMFGIYEVIALALALGGFGVKANPKAPSADVVLEYAVDDADAFAYVDAVPLIPGDSSVLKA